MIYNARGFDVHFKDHLTTVQNNQVQRRKYTLQLKLKGQEGTETHYFKLYLPNILV